MAELLNYNELQKARIQNSFIQDGDDFFEKGGKQAVDGEVRVWGGKRYVKHTDGWVHIGLGSAHVKNNSGVKPAQEHHVAHAKEHLARHDRGAADSSLDDYKKKIGGEGETKEQILTRKPHLQSTEFHTESYTQTKDGWLHTFDKDMKPLSILHPGDENIEDIKKLIDLKKKPEVDTRSADDKFNDELIPSLEEDARKTKVKKKDEKKESAIASEKKEANSDYSKKYVKQKYTPQPLKEGDLFMYPYSNGESQVAVSKILGDGQVLVGEANSWDAGNTRPAYSNVSRNIRYSENLAEHRANEKKKKEFDKKEIENEATHNMLHELKFDKIKGGDLKSTATSQELGSNLKKFIDLAKKYSVADNSIPAGGFSGANSSSMTMSRSGKPVDIELNGIHRGGYYGFNRAFLVLIKTGGALPYEQQRVLDRVAQQLLSKFTMSAPEGSSGTRIDSDSGTNYNSNFLVAPEPKGGKTYYALSDQAVNTIHKEIYGR